MRFNRWQVLSIVMVLALPGLALAQPLDKNAQRIVNDATKDLKSKEPAKRAAALDNLKSWGGAQTVPLIVGALKDPDASVRAAAAEALWDDKMKSESARPALMAALDDPSPNVVVMAAGALRLLGMKNVELQKAHDRALSTASDVRIRFLAARSLIGLVPSVRLVNPLVQYLERQATADSSQGLKLAEDALTSLVESKDKTMLVPLLEAVPDMTRGAERLLRVLGKVQPKPTGWTTLLINETKSSDYRVRQEAVSLMRDQKADAEVAQWAPVAARLLATDAETGVRSSAASSLGGAGGAAHAHAAVVLTAARKDREPRVRDSAFDALGDIVGRLGTAPMATKTAMAKTAQPEILAAIETDPDKDVREEALDTLDALALDPGVAASLLVGIASKPAMSETIRTIAIRKLGNRGPEAKAAVADLQKLRTDANAAVRTEAVGALERINDRSPVPARPGTPVIPSPGRAANSLPSAPNPDAEARGLAVLRANKVEFDEDQFNRALYEVNLDVARAFLDAGMSANHRFRGRSQTPLMILLSSQACSPTVRPTAAPTKTLLQLVIERGGDASLADANGNTSLMDAAMSGCDGAVMSTLIKAGGKINAKNQAGLTAFEAGLFAGHDGLDALVAAGYRLPAEKVKMYMDAYKANPKAVALVKRAAP